MSRPVAVIVTARLPWPLDDGGRIALWQTVWSAAQSYRTIVLSLVPPGEAEDPMPPEWAALGLALVRVPHRPPSHLRTAFRSSLGPWPHTLARYRNPRLAAALREIVAHEGPDFVLFNNLHTATYAPDARPAAVVLREQNAEFLWLERFAEGLRNPLVRWYSGWQSRRMRAAERRLCEQADLVLAIQPDEVSVLRALAPRARVEWLPLGLERARFAAPAAVTPPIALVIGSWNWAPNADGLRRFLAQGAPRLRERRPDVRLRVVGKGMGPALEAEITAAGGEAVGYVESVIEEFASASVLVVPLWVGAGVRVKIVEALAAGLAVVATPMAAEGIGLVHGRNYIAAETPVGLAEAAAALLDDPARRGALAGAGRRLAQEQYALEVIADHMNRHCADAASRARLRANPGTP